MSITLNGSINVWASNDGNTSASRIIHGHNVLYSNYNLFSQLFRSCALCRVPLFQQTPRERFFLGTRIISLMPSKDKVTQLQLICWLLMALIFTLPLLMEQLRKRKLLEKTSLSSCSLISLKELHLRWWLDRTKCYIFFSKITN